MAKKKSKTESDAPEEDKGAEEEGSTESSASESSDDESSEAQSSEDGDSEDESSDDEEADSSDDGIADEKSHDEEMLEEALKALSEPPPPPSGPPPPEPPPAAEEHDDHHVPDRKQYWQIWFVLLVLTILEVGVAYMTDYVSKTALVVCLISMAVAKAMIVALFYMHLKHETKYMKWTVAFPACFPALYAMMLIAEGAYRAIWGHG